MKIVESIQEYIANMKVRKQLLGIYVIVILIPILIIGIYLTNMLCNMVVEKSVNEAQVNIERIKERLDDKVRIVNFVAEVIYANDKVKRVLSTKYEDNLQIINDYATINEIGTYLAHYKELNSIRIYTTNSTLLNNSYFIQVTPQIQNEQWYKKALLRGSYMEWCYKYDEYRNEYYLSLIRTLKTRENKHLGVLVINVNTNQIKDIIKDEPYETAILLDGEIITSTGDKAKIKNIMGKLQDIQLEEDKISKLKVKTKEGEGDVIYLNYVPSKTKETNIGICVYMEIDALTKETRQIVTKSLNSILISIGIATALIVAFSKRFSERIILVRKEMAKVVTGDFNIRRSISGKDEIGELYEDIYCTVESVQKLVKEIYETKMQKEEFKRRQKEMQFEMLASQINPHFLYNTLETIRMRALCNGDVELAGIVKMLSKLLRRNLEVSDKSVLLSSELEMMKAYLEIQRFRFGERITYDIDCKIEASQYKILPLLLQPIVENAFIHGLEGKIGSGKILCQLYEKDERLYIVVEDNGLGIKEDKLLEIISSLENSDDKIGRVGLRNIYERIKLYYGKEYGITIESKLNKGTKVRMVLPIIKGGV